MRQRQQRGGSLSTVCKRTARARCVMTFQQSAHSTWRGCKLSMPVTLKWLVLNVVISAAVGALIAVALVNSNVPLSFRPQVAIATPITRPTPTPIPAIVPKTNALADNLDRLAREPQVPSGVFYSSGGSPIEQATAAARELRAQAEADPSPQAQAVLALVPQIDAAISTPNPLELNRLAVQLRSIR
jgi:hypothetical protein